MAHEHFLCSQASFHVSPLPCMELYVLVRPQVTKASQKFMSQLRHKSKLPKPHRFPDKALAKPAGLVSSLLSQYLIFLERIQTQKVYIRVDRNGLVRFRVCGSFCECLPLDAESSREPSAIGSSVQEESLPPARFLNMLSLALSYMLEGHE